MKFIFFSLLLLAAASLSSETVVAGDTQSSVRTSVVEVCEFAHTTRDGASCSAVGIVMGGTSVSRKLTTSELPEKWPVILPGGSEIGFFRASSVGLRSTGGSVPRNWDLYLIELQGGGERRITNMEFYDCYGMSVSPDGRDIVFSAMLNEYPNDSYFELRIIPAVSIPPGTKRFIGGRVLLHNGTHNILPVFSLDGKAVLYIAKSRRKRTLTEVINPFRGTVLFKWELCLLDIATGGVRVLDVSTNPIEGHRFLSGIKQITYRNDGQTQTVQY